MNVVPQKIVSFLGEAGVGKTSIIFSRLSGSINEIHTETITTERFHEPKEDNIFSKLNNIDIIYFDTAGQERFRSLSALSVRESSIIVLVFDLFAIATLQAIPSFYQFVNDYVNQNVKLILVGNKYDLLNQNDEAEIFESAKRMAEKLGCSFIAISALEGGDSIRPLFVKIAQLLSEDLDEEIESTPNKVIKIDASGKEEKDSCC